MLKNNANKYFGINTIQAINNFKISDLKIPLEVIKSLALIKMAYASIHKEGNLLPKEQCDAIIKASTEILEGKFDSYFPVDVFQTGSGTSTNMNLNEVIANRASELLNFKTIVHPNDDVNKGQSTNDTFPASIQISLSILIDSELLPSLKKLYQTLKIKQKEFGDVLKAGRTHMMDALPITLGEEFSAYAEQIKKTIETINFAKIELLKLPLGATAVGTGFGTTKERTKRVINFINKKTKKNFSMCKNLFEGISSKENLVNYSSSLKRCSVALMKISEDLRLMASGPKCGLSEIEIPSLQAGSSIMAGKVNPVILEMVQMVSAQIIGFDLSNTICGMGGRFELNVMMPLLAHNLVTATKILSNALNTLNDKCVSHIKANREKCKFYFENTPSIVTFLQPIIGYEMAASIYKESLEKGVGVKDLILQKGILSEKELNKFFNPKNQVKIKNS